MLISFRVRNFRSIDAEQELLLTRSSRMTTSDVREQAWDAALTPVVALYGANASGKSNVLRAMHFMAEAVENSHASWKRRSWIPFHPFALNADSAKSTSSFEVEFSIEGVRYQYGFENDRERFSKEWMYAYPRGRRQIWFERDADEDDVWYFGKGLAGPNRVIADTVRPNSLFLSAAATADHKRLASLYDWFTMNMHVAAEDNYESRLHYTLRNVEGDSVLAEQVTNLLRHADLGIRSLEVVHADITDEERERVARIARVIAAEAPGGSEDDADAIANRILQSAESSVKLAHACVDGELVTLPFDAESLGTKSLMALAGPIMQALDSGTTLIVDEVDTSLHPRIVAEIVRLFQSPERNTRQAQLIFTTHDTTLLGNMVDGKPVLDRDQVWLVEKGRDGSSVIYPLSDFSPRKYENLERGYLQGRYGGVPFMDVPALGVSVPVRARAGDAESTAQAEIGS